MSQDHVTPEPIVGQEGTMGTKPSPDKHDAPINQSQAQPLPAPKAPEDLVQQKISPNRATPLDMATPSRPENPSKNSQPDSGSASNGSTSKGSNLDLIMSIPVTVQVILGSTKLPVSKIMQLGRNAIIPLDRNVGDPIDVVVNGRTVARGEVVLMEDDDTRFGISITELVTN